MHVHMTLLYAKMIVVWWMLCCAVVDWRSKRDNVHGMYRSRRVRSNLGEEGDRSGSEPALQVS